MDGWRKLFYPAIIARGKFYYDEGRIKETWQDNGLVRAIIEGTEEYEVWIDPVEEDGGCTCPYASNGSSCKHMAAMFIALDEGGIAYQECPPATPIPVERKPYEIPWLKAIDGLPEEILRKELMRVADQSPYLQERLAILFYNGLPEGMLEEWRADLREEANEYMDRHGYIDPTESQGFIWALERFIRAKTKSLIKVTAAEDAFAVLKIAVETGALYPFHEEEKDYLLDLKEECIVAIEKICSIASDSLKQEMKAWLENSFERIPMEGDFPQYEIAFNHPTLVFTPFYRQIGSGDEWKEVPRDGEGGYYYDPIEQHPDYKKIESFINRRARDIAGYGTDVQNLKDFFEVKKKMLKERHRILWHSFIDLNPSERID